MWAIALAALAVVLVKPTVVDDVRAKLRQFVGAAKPCCDNCADGKPCAGTSASSPPAYDAPKTSAFDDIERTEARWDSDETASDSVRAAEGDPWGQSLAGVGMEGEKW